MHDLVQYLNLNSAVIETRNLYSQEQYEKIMQNQNHYIPHFHQLVTDGARTRLYIDDTERVLDVIKCNYEEFYSLESNDKIEYNMQYICSITNQMDMNCFLKDVILFEEQGIIRYPNFFVEDECRWYNICNMKYLTRMNIDANGGLRPCKGCGCIGEITDSYYVNMRKVAKCQDQEYLKRGCRECSVKEICSKCALVVNCLDSEQYCSIRREHPLLADFLDKKNMYFFLGKYSLNFTKEANSRLIFSNPKHSVVFPFNQNDIFDCSRKVYLMFLNGRPLLYNMKQSSLFEIDYQLAFILEGYLKNFEEEEIASFYAKEYGVEFNKGLNKAQRGLELLRNTGVIG